MEFLTEHGLELFTTFLGLIYLYYEYKASIWLWLLGIIMPMIDIYLFATSGMYAYAFISFVFVLVAVYGVLNWKFGGKGHTERLITHMTFKKIVRYLLATAVIFGITYQVLVTFTVQFYGRIASGVNVTNPDVTQFLYTASAVIQKGKGRSMTQSASGIDIRPVNQ